MGSKAELLRLLEEWRRLTGRECQAILSEDWKCVAEQQDLKLNLRQAITRELEPKDDPSNPEAAADKRRIDSLVSELVALETRNRDLIGTKRTTRWAELDGLNATGRKLKNVRRAYGDHRGAQWESYS